MRLLGLFTGVWLSSAICFAQSGPGILEPIVQKNTYQNPTSMMFLGPNDILVGGFEGKIWRTTDGITSHIQTLPGGYGGEAGFVYLQRDPAFEETNYIYASFINTEEFQWQVNRYLWDGARLTSRTKLFDLGPGAGQHVGGPFVFGPPDLPVSQQKIFAVVGDKNRATPTANSDFYAQSDESAMIVRMNRDGSTPVGDERGPFYDVAEGNRALQRMYAYGIRNSYGIGFDPVTGDLWETENGDFGFEEINRIEPGMNGGWKKLRGPISLYSNVTTESMTYFGDPPVGHYSDPEFSFVVNQAKVPTAILFYDRNELGLEYKNQCFVALTSGDRPGIYHFKLNETRTEFIFDDPAYDDKILGGSTQYDPYNEILFAHLPEDAIVDMRIGPDNMLYALGIGTGRILKVVGVSTGVDEWDLY